MRLNGKPRASSHCLWTAPMVCKERKRNNLSELTRRHRSKSCCALPQAEVTPGQPELGQNRNEARPPNSPLRYGSHHP